jgi:alpha-tubulin suppressor-like RCC1 family protein
MMKRTMFVPIIETCAFMRYIKKYRKTFIQDTHHYLIAQRDDGYLFQTGRKKNHQLLKKLYLQFKLKWEY